jgi:hypothetical protein
MMGRQLAWAGWLLAHQINLNWNDLIFRFYPQSPSQPIGEAFKELNQLGGR